ncbi:MAG: FeoB-associated Cys-rich membrane protein [Flavicella sp.]|nr:FeoB-associated Cys-rich membrane protein [Flavicella sp.]
MQEILVYVFLGLAMVFLLKKFIFKGKNNTDCDSDCGCH